MQTFTAHTDMSWAIPGQSVRFAEWRPLGFAWVAGLLGLILIAALTCLLMKYRRHNRPLRLRVGLVYSLQYQATFLPSLSLSQL